MDWAQWNEHTFQEDIAAVRAKHGIVNAVDTGPATWEDIVAARTQMGNPETHEDWLKGCKR